MAPNRQPDAAAVAYFGKGLIMSAEAFFFGSREAYARIPVPCHLYALGKDIPMCDMNAYLLRENDRELVMESVETMEDRQGRLHLSNIFGEEKLVSARFHLIENNAIFLKPV